MNLYIAALSTIALFAITGQALIQYSLYQQSSDARVVNYAGRQRFLSLKLTMAICGLTIPSDPIDRESRINEVKDTFTALVHERQGLIYGDPGLGLPGNNSQTVMQLLNSIEPNFQGLKGAVNSILDKIDKDKAADIVTPINGLIPYVDIVLAQEEGFATTMDTTVSQYQHEAEDRVTRLRVMEIVLCLLTLCVLLLEGAFVFHPAIKKLANTLLDLLQAERHVEAQVVELEQKNSDLELAFEEAVIAHRKVMPHARVVALGRYQVQGSRGQYYDVESRQFNGTMLLECNCPMYSRSMICSHSLAAGSLHSALLRQISPNVRPGLPNLWPPDSTRREKEII